MPEPGRREQNKRATREALQAAAWRSIESHGFAATTVEAVAEAAGVSGRTFFRYFASKEDVVLGDLDAALREFCEAFANRPPGEPTILAAPPAPLCLPAQPPPR